MMRLMQRLVGLVLLAGALALYPIAWVFDRLDKRTNKGVQ